MVTTKITKKKVANKGGVQHGKVFVTRQFRRAGEDWGPEEVEKQNQIEVKVFPEGVTPAVVTAKYGLTLNLGNYKSARIDAGVSIPCFHEEVRDAFIEAWKICRDEIKPQVAQVTQSRGDK